MGYGDGYLSSPLQILSSNFNKSTSECIRESIQSEVECHIPEEGGSGISTFKMNYATPIGFWMN